MKAAEAWPRSDAFAICMEWRNFTDINKCVDNLC